MKKTILLNIAIWLGVFYSLDWGRLFFFFPEIDIKYKLSWFLFIFIVQPIFFYQVKNNFPKFNRYEKWSSWVTYLAIFNIVLFYLPWEFFLPLLRPSLFPFCLLFSFGVSPFLLCQYYFSAEVLEEIKVSSKFQWVKNFLFELTKGTIQIFGWYFCIAINLLIGGSFLFGLMFSFFLYSKGFNVYFTVEKERVKILHFDKISKGEDNMIEEKLRKKFLPFISPNSIPCKASFILGSDLALIMQKNI